MIINLYLIQISKITRSGFLPTGIQNIGCFFPMCLVMSNKWDASCQIENLFLYSVQGKIVYVVHVPVQLLNLLISIVWTLDTGYFRIIIVHGGPMYVALLGYPCPRIYIPGDVYNSNC